MQYEPWQRGWRVTGRWEGGRYEETVSCEDGRDSVGLYIYVYLHANSIFKKMPMNSIFTLFFSQNTVV